MMKKIAFLHPDLGIGGAERAIVDAAMALKSKKFDITIFTNHHDTNHCFDETKNGELNIIVIGDFLPRSLFGFFCAFFAYFRLVIAALYIILFHFNKFDLIYIDQISAPIPILKLFGFEVLFYAHFPDLLLSKRGGTLKSIYRFAIDFTEKFSLSFADEVLFNSKFTGNVYRQHFKYLRDRELQILYPVPNVDNLVPYECNLPIDVHNDTLLFLSINRYEEKKNINLGLKAFASLLKQMDDSFKLDRMMFVHIGGFDDLVTENREVFERLSDLAEDLQIRNRVSLLKSCSNDVKVNFLRRATALLYTPSNEHFGIVPLEAMYLECPVIAVNSGGPMETVLDGVTGFLCEPEPDDFARVMKRLTDEKDLKKKLGEAGRNRVCRDFSFRNFQDKLETIVTTLIESKI